MRAFVVLDSAARGRGAPHTFQDSATRGSRPPRSPGSLRWPAITSPRAARRCNGRAQRAVRPATRRLAATRSREPARRIESRVDSKAGPAAASPRLKRAARRRRDPRDEATRTDGLRDHCGASPHSRRPRTPSPHRRDAHREPSAGWSIRNEYAATSSMVGRRQRLAEDGQAHDMTDAATERTRAAGREGVHALRAERAPWTAASRCRH
jgi:hypothetical protein